MNVQETRRNNKYECACLCLCVLAYVSAYSRASSINKFLSETFQKHHRYSSIKNNKNVNEWMNEWINEGKPFEIKLTISNKLLYSFYSLLNYPRFEYAIGWIDYIVMF